MTVEPGDGAAILRRSKVLFGNQHMLLVCRFIAESPGTFTLSDVCSATGVALSTGHRLMSALVAGGLIDRLPRTMGERMQWYTRTAHAFWAAAVELASDASRSQQSSTDVRATGRNRGTQ